MKFYPILFSTEMVQAILEGRKTQTRRVVKNADEIAENPHAKGWFINENGMAIQCPYGQPGDVLWVRETWSKIITPDSKEAFVYKADDDFYKDTIEDWSGWKPNIHMPKEAARLFLFIKSVRVERLNEISEEDAIAEGVQLIEFNCFKNYMQGKDWVYDGLNQNGYEMIEDPVGSFSSLWSSIYGYESWTANPWVWVIEFEPIQKPNNFLQP